MAGCVGQGLYSAHVPGVRPAAGAGCANNFDRQSGTEWWISPCTRLCVHHYMCVVMKPRQEIGAILFILLCLCVCVCGDAGQPTRD